MRSIRVERGFVACVGLQKTSYCHISVSGMQLLRKSQKKVAHHRQLVMQV